MKSLSTLIKWQKTHVDEQRVILAKLQEKLDAVEQAIADLEQEKLQEQASAKKNPEKAVTYGAYVKEAIRRGEMLQKQRWAVEEAVTGARDKLTELFEEQKRYEIAEANRIEIDEKKERQRETAELDEIGGVTHGRQKGDG
jgi:hypothetical protein